MSEDLEDMRTGIPPYNGRSMFEMFAEAKKLKETGVNIDNLPEEHTFNYIKDQYRYYVTTLGRSATSRFFANETLHPLIVVGRVDENGHETEQTMGLFIGVSLTGDGNFPVDALPPEGEEFLPVVVETLPSPEQPDELPHILVMKG